MSAIELERIFLCKRLPSDILKQRNIIIQIGDLTLTNDVDILKIRRKGDSYELIKKERVSGIERIEHQIQLNKQEYDLLYSITVRKHIKRRFFYPLNNQICEIDIYLEEMLGYVRVEVEFNQPEEMQNFKCPDWFGDEITSFNHEIHADLGAINFQTMVERYKKKGIILPALFLPSEEE